MSSESRLLHNEKEDFPFLINTMSHLLGYDVDDLEYFLEIYYWANVELNLDISDFYDIKLDDRNDIYYLIYELFYSIEDTVFKESINVLNDLFDGNTYLRFSNIVLNTEQKNDSEDSNYGIKGTLRQFIDYFESYFDDNKENFSICGCESSFNNSLDECICYKSKEETIHNFIKYVYSEYRLDFGFSNTIN